MEEEKYYFETATEMKLEKLPIILECVRFFELITQDKKCYKSHVNDLQLDTENGVIYAFEDEIPLYCYDQNLISICAPSYFDGYEIQGKNFFMKLYE